MQLQDLTSLYNLLPQTMLRDRRILRARLQAVEHRARQQKPFDRSLQRLVHEIEKSAAELARRQANIPRPTYPQDLPVVQKRDEIAKAISENQVVVICGETGSGKTTQLPKICLELGRGVSGMIGHTQPRRIAARSVAMRIAQELDTPLGQDVGYKVRFSDKLSENTYIKLMTDGILLAETQSDPNFEQYDTIIIDEAHERSLNIDFLLGYLRQLLPKRPDLKLIITSATIDPQRFSRHFDNAPIVMVSGRTYPVEVRYRPLQSQDPDEEDLEMEQAILRGIDELWQTGGPGDTLVFLPGEREIRETAEALRKHHPQQTEILPLYARLSADEQMRVFQPHTRRRIILATNVAETSLTVPGIRYVIDPGVARISRYAPRTKVQRLPIEPISQASAEQRKGRCGRVSEGVCIRLYSEEDFNRRPQYTDPEILRTNLASVILQMKALKLGDIHEFPFIDPPDTRAIRDGYQTLHEIGAIDEKNELTEIGRMLARLPIDPRIGRMVLAARDENVLEEVLIIAAALSVQDPRERPMDKQGQADSAHARFRDESSDFLGFLKLWDWFGENERHLSGSRLRKLCKESFVSFIRMREWHDIHSQLREIVGEMGLIHRNQSSPAAQANGRPVRRDDRDARTTEAIHRALLSGLLSNIGVRGDGFEYNGARGSKFHIFPGSALFNRKPAWLMAAELIQTTKLYARTVAPIRPEWIERIAPHLLKKTCSEPYWQPHTGHVMAYEKVTLYGLTIVPRRAVHYGPIDPRTSRAMFIQHALVEGDWYTDGKFFRHNRELIEQIQTIENKARRRDLLVDQQAMFDFYDKRIPASVYNGPLFEKWRRQAEAQAPQLLFMTTRDLMRYEADIAWDQFPDQLLVNDMALPLEYRLEPGHPMDGVTVTIPLATLNQIPPEPFEWLVPGLLKEKILALIRSLPRTLRTNFVPAPDYAEAAHRALRARAGSLLDLLAEFLGKQSGVQISRWDFQLDTLPDHLRMNFRLVDAQGREVAIGRDLAELRQKVGVAAQQTFSAGAEKHFHRDGITRWDFGELPPKVQVSRHGMQLVGYPALVDAGTSVSLRVLDTPQSAAAATRAGLRRLFMLQLAGEIKSLARRLPIDELCLLYALIGEENASEADRRGVLCDELRNDIVTAAADRALYPNETDGPGDVRSRDQFIDRAEAAWRRLPAAADELVEIARGVLATHQSLRLRLDEPYPPLLQPSIQDIRAHLSSLVPRGFLLSTPSNWLGHLPRFLRAIEIRLKKLTNAGLPRDVAAMQTIAPLWQRYADRAAELSRRGIIDPQLQTYRWMLEELRVSLFAQELKTSIPISVQRLERQWAMVQK
ncbi:ATP-dependent RNA helicase HrpA [Fontivita pretiosa]|uniref:ATP-dependent RNA helicase HrpA n=1 Tax=Fontivita pretiosa TaxID=2989684 RepID=UPI003D17D626